MTYLISCRHDRHHGKFLDLHLRDSHGGQEADLRGAHVGALGQHTLATLDVVTDRPDGTDRTENAFGGRYVDAESRTQRGWMQKSFGKITPKTIFFFYVGVVACSKRVHFVSAFCRWKSISSN